MQLKSRLTLIAAGAVALVMIVLIWTALEAREQARQSVNAVELRSQEAVWREVLAGTHQRLEALLDRVAATPHRPGMLPDGDGAALPHLLPGVISLPGEAEPHLQIVARDGSVLAMRPERVRAAGLLDATALQRAFASDATLRSVTQEAGRSVVAVVARRLALPANEGESALVASLPLDAALQRFAGSVGGEAFLVNRRGALLGASDPALWSLVEPVALAGEVGSSSAQRDQRSYAILRLAVTDITGHPVAYLLSLRDVTDQAQAARLWGWVVALAALTLLGAVVLGLHLLVRKELQPLDRTVTILGALARGEVNQPIESRARKDEVGQILRSLSSFRDSLILARTAERQKDKFLRRQSELLSLQRELRIAADIQQSILPKTFPERAEFAVAALMRPAKEVGGDFFDVFETREGRLGFCVADVSDKGVPAALFMAVSRTLVHQEGATGASPSQVMARANDALSRDNPSVMFVTAVYAEIDPASGTLRLSNAGHNAPYILRPGKGLIRLDHKSGPALGVMEELPYGETEVTLEPGDLVFAFTDGISEAFDRNGQEFGTDRMEALLAEQVEATPDRLITAVLDAVRDFSAGVRQSDDITCLAVRWAGPQS